MNYQLSLLGDTLGKDWEDVRNVEILHSVQIGISLGIRFQLAVAIEESLQVLFGTRLELVMVYPDGGRKGKDFRNKARRTITA